MPPYFRYRFVRTHQHTQALIVKKKYNFAYATLLPLFSHSSTRPRLLSEEVRVSLPCATVRLLVRHCTPRS